MLGRVVVLSATLKLVNEMKNLTGVWVFTQHWHGNPLCQFKVEFGENGSISVKEGRFLAADTPSEGSLRMASPLPGFIDKINDSIGNLAQGILTNQSGQRMNGVWNAFQLIGDEPEEKSDCPLLA